MNNKHSFIALAILCLISIINPLNAQKPTDEVDQYLQQVIKENNVPGLAVAVLDQDEVIYEGYFGLASLEYQVPVNESTLFRLYSSTKMIINTAVFKLVDENRLDISQPISQYLDELPRQWQPVKVIDLLAHASGIPNFISLPAEWSDQQVLDSLSQMPMVFPTGHYHDYNQTNYWLLAQIIEKISGEELGDYITNQLFDGNPRGIAFSSGSADVIANRSSKYTYDHQAGGYLKLTDLHVSRGLAGNGININMPKLIEWAKKLSVDIYFSESTKALMWKPYHFEEMPDYRFAAGWNIYTSGKGASIGFTGGGVSAIRVFPNQNLTVLVMSNGFQYNSVHNDIVTRVAGFFNEELKNEEQILMDETVSELIQEKPIAMDKLYESISQKLSNDRKEGFFNSLGYVLIGYRKYHLANSVLKLNAEKYSKSANTYDSLGESFIYLDDLQSALKNYRKVLELDPDNRNARQMISKIQDRMG
ncbi:serine hydrolase [Roseivirga sp.]|uniref:serine hydrolase n=1 Tax=Roseivirga sp. TaxID=1964215 RepID=UPI003B52A597